MLESIKQYIGFFLLKNKWNPPSLQPRKFQNWNDIKTILILVDVTEKLDNKAIINIAEAFKKEGKQTTILGYQNTKNEAAYNYHQVVFNNKDINFFYLPNDKITNQIKSKEFDVLIDCNFNNQPTLTYFQKLISATCKIGFKTSNYYDLSILSELKIESYIEQVKNYLLMIKSN